MPKLISTVRNWINALKALRHIENMDMAYDSRLENLIAVLGIRRCVRRGDKQAK